MEINETYFYKDFLIRKSHLKEEDIPSLIELLQKVYNNSVNEFTEHYVRWKYLNYPDGKVIMYQALTKEGKIVATRSTAPTTMIIQGEPVRTFFNIDAGTDPEYRGRNLYSVLQQQHMEDNGKDTFILTYPNKGIAYNTYLNKLGSHLLDNVKVTFIPYSLTRSFFTKIKNRWAKKPSIFLKVVDNFSEKVDEYFKNKKNYNNLITKKYSADLLNWLTVESKAYANFRLIEIYENQILIGVFIYLLRKKYEVEILKIDFNINENYQKYVPHLINYIYVTENARLVYMWKTRNTYLKKALDDIGFIINQGNENQFGTHFFPAIIFSELTKINGVDIFDAANYELDIFTRDFI